MSQLNGNMATSCGTWRNKPFKRRAEVKLTSSPPVRSPCTPAHQSLEVLWLLPTIFYWGKHLHCLHLPHYRGLPLWRNSPLLLLLPCQHPSSSLGPEDGTLHQILWRVCLWAEPLWRQHLGRPPSSKRGEVHPWYRALKLSHVEAFSQDSDLVREARREFFSKHSYNFTTDGTHNLSEIFRQMATSADLLGTSIHEIQASWTGPEELKQVKCALWSLPKGLKFLWAVPPSKSPKVMGLVEIHNPNALCQLSGITYCPWCRKEGQNKGTMVNHLWTVHYRLVLVCNRCYDCLSAMSNTLHCHGQQDCHQPRENNTNESVPSK